MSSPLVSVIIPLYNAAQFIVETIDSVLNQTYQNIEIIIVDDGSTDQSLQKVAALTNNQIRWFKQTNKGASAARNYGLKEAKGDYIQFLDADDLLATDKIEKQISLLQNSANTVAYCSTVYFPDGANHLFFTPNSDEGSFMDYSKDPVKFMINLWGGYTGKGSMIAVQAWLTPKILIDKVGGWNEQLSLDDDGEFFARIALNADQLIYTNTFCYYRKFEDRQSLSRIKNEKAYESLYQSICVKKQILLGKTNDLHAQYAIYRLYTDFSIQTYLKHHHLYKKASAEIPKVSYPFKIEFGGKKFIQMVNRYLGWKAAFLVRNLYYKLNAR